MSLTPLVAPPPQLAKSPLPVAASSRNDSKGPVIAGALVVAAVLAVVVMFAFSSGSNSSDPAQTSQFGTHTVDALAGLLPVAAPDGWTITNQKAAGDTGITDGRGPEKGASPLDPSASTEPANCARPIKQDSVVWAARVTMQSNNINPVTMLRDSVVVMIGVPRPKSDAIAEYRKSLSLCPTFSVTNPQTSAVGQVRQDLFNPTIDNADSILGLQMKQTEDRKRPVVDYVILAQRHDVVVKALASQYNSVELAKSTTAAALQKLGS